MPSVHFFPTFFLRMEFKCLYFSGLFFKQNREWRGTTLRTEEWTHISGLWFFPVIYKNDVIYIHDSAEFTGSYPFSMLGSLEPHKPILCFHRSFFFKALHVNDDFRQKCKPPSLDCAFLPLPGLTFPENFRFDILQVTVDAWPASEGRDHTIGIHVLDSAHAKGFWLEGVTILDRDFPVEGRAHLMR